MKGGTKRRAPEFVVRNGEPSAVILGIDEYRAMLERLEDVEDLKLLERMRKRPLRFRKLEEFLAEYPPLRQYSHSFKERLGT